MIPLGEDPNPAAPEDAAPAVPDDLRREAHFQALVESSEDAILSKSTENVITSWNPAAERLYGWSAEEAIGRTISIIVPETHANEEWQILARILAGERIEHFETERRRKDGSLIDVSLTVSPIHGPEGDIVGASVVARDITQQVTQRKRAQLLQEISSKVAREAEPERAIAVLLREGMRALGADAGTVGLLDDDGETVVLADETGHTPKVPMGWTRFPLSAEMPMCVAIRKLEPVWSSTAADLKARFPALADAHIPFHALAVLPLAVQGRPRGAISFSFADPRSFSPEERAFIEALARQASFALERAQLYERERRARERLSFLARASELLGESLDLESTLSHLANLAVRHMCDWCVVDVMNAEGVLENVAIAHVDRSKVELARELRRRYLPDPKAPIGPLWVAQTRQPQLLEEVSDETLVTAAQDDEHLRLIRELGLVSAMVLPLIARDRTLGTITFAASSPSRPFGADDLELAEELARRAAVAIDSALLYRREHQTALTLQRALLPGGLPEVEGVQVATRYLPAEAGVEIGGDWYDMIKTAADQVAVAIGDVAGKGVAAAAVMGRLAMGLRAYLVEGRPVESAVAGLDWLMKQFDTAKMATIFALTIDPASGRARYVRAGHPPPLLRAPDGSVLELPGEAGPALGLLDNPGFPPSETTLERGASLLLYTDGLVERRRHGSEAGIARLKEAFADAPADPEGVVDTVAEALGAERVPDDIALLALRLDR